MASIHHVRRLYYRRPISSRIMIHEPKVMLFGSSSCHKEISMQQSLSSSYSTFSSIKSKIQIQNNESLLFSSCNRATMNSMEQSMMCHQKINNMVGRLHNSSSSFSSSSSSKQFNSTPSNDDASSDWMGFMNLVEPNKKNDNDTHSSKNENKTSMDLRAQIKLQTLEKVKEEANQLKHKVYNNTIKSPQTEESIKEWLQKEEELARAYSQAIKYVARNTKRKLSAKHAEGLLQEMIVRMGISYDYAEENNLPFRKKDIVWKMIQSAPDNDIKNESLSGDTTKQNNNIILSRRDFHNVLHSWASSKAKRKGNYAEALLRHMAELSYRYPNILGDVKPNSQTFALVIKCHAGSTRKFTSTFNHSFIFIPPPLPATHTAIQYSYLQNSLSFCKYNIYLFC